MMQGNLTQEELDREFYGPPPKVEVEFFEKEVTDVPASKAQGHRVMKTVTYVHLVCHREKAEITRPAQPQDQRMFPREWMAYEQERANAESDAGHRPVQDLQPRRSRG